MKCAVYLNLILFVNVVTSARILSVFPIPSISHQVVFRPYTQELARRGHEVVIITPNPALPKDRPKDNITEIDVGFSYDYIAKYFDVSIFKKGVVVDVPLMTADLYSAYVEVMKEQINFGEVKVLIEDDKQKFDLVVTESFFSMDLIFGDIFKAPVIQFSSFHGLPSNYETVGSLGAHPLYYPNFNRNKFRNLSLWDKLVEIYYELKLKYEFWRIDQHENQLLNEIFGAGVKTIDELRNNVAMLFINTHAIFGDNRPVTPGVLYLGSLQLQPVKPIPQELKDYLDSSKRGVIYVSLGSNVVPSRMDKDLLNAFLDAFKRLPYDILWKFDGDALEGLPDNVKIQKWFPQRDMLNHSNIKAFVTQGGLQSTDEAIDVEVPLVGIPMLGDQFFNVNKYVELGIGVQLDALTLTADDFVNAVNIVVENKSYKENIRKLRLIYQDQPEKPLDRAIWWTEHVIRHKGASHLRAPTANMSWCQYYMVGVLTFVLIIVFAVILVMKYTLKKILFTLRKVKKD